MAEHIKLGLIINPVAGLGGSLALKGSDQANIRRRAARGGVASKVQDRTRRALELLADLVPGLHFYTAAGEMGESLLREMDIPCEVVWPSADGKTTARDTVGAARAIAARGPLVLVFAGGDGTARNIADALGANFPVLGIPAGVKIHSAVYAGSPVDAGRLLRKAVMRRGCLETERREVMDIDEEAFREGRVVSRLYGYLSIPGDRRLLQSRKAGGLVTEAAVLRGIAHRVAQDMEPGVVYLMGGGTTVEAVMGELGLHGTLLGVDLVLDRRLLKADATAVDIEQTTKTMPCKAVLTMIGGQGHIIGRGNQQLSPTVLGRMRKEDLILIATKEKLLTILGRPMRIDTGDPVLDKRLAGHYRVIVGYDETVMYRAE